MKYEKKQTSKIIAMILRQPLENHFTISDLAEKYGLYLNAIYIGLKSNLEIASSRMTKTIR